MRAKIPCGRRLHLIDVENLVGCPRPTCAEVVDCRQHYAELIRPARGDQCVVACNHGAGAEVGFNWPGAQLRLRSGPDGADLALLDEIMDYQWVSERFAAVVVASGDGLFTWPTAELGRRGVRVTVVANRTSLSRRLQLAAAQVVLFDMVPGALGHGDAA